MEAVESGNYESDTTKLLPYTVLKRKELSHMSELVTTNRNAVTQGSVSLFESPAQMLQLAEALKNSTFVPKALRGDAGNVFLAIELAGRTGLPLMATLQGMYVITGRDRYGNETSTGKPSFYAGFVHALIRKSGVYIDTYYEEGEDGTVTRTEGGRSKQVPNRTCRLVAVRHDGARSGADDIAGDGRPCRMEHAQPGDVVGIHTDHAQNRAVTFFARQCCPGLIHGIDPDGDRALLHEEAESGPSESLKSRLAKHAKPEANTDTDAEEAEAEPKPRAEQEPQARAGQEEKQEPEPEADAEGEARATGEGEARAEAEDLEGFEIEPLGIEREEPSEFFSWLTRKIDAAKTVEELEEVGQQIRKARRTGSGNDPAPDAIRRTVACIAGKH